MTDTSTDTNNDTDVGTSKRPPKKSDPDAVLIEVIKENPKAPQRKHVDIFIGRIQEEEYEDEHREVLRLWCSLDYNKCYRMANPPSEAERQAATEKRRAERERLQAEIDAKAMERLLLMEIKMPNGKLLRDCTFGECRTIGGQFLELSDRGEPNEIVGQKLTEEQVREILETR